MRLDKYVMNGLKISRTDAKKIIKSKCITVNNDVKIKSDYDVLTTDCVKYNDEIIVYKENLYLMLNKPQGYVCATFDHVNKTVIDLIGNDKLLICGRLDKDTEGLLLLTTDGKFVHRMTSPKHEIWKKYYVEVEGEFSIDDNKLFCDGIEITDDRDDSYYKCKSAILEIVNKNCAFISIREGKFHQIKKMCQACGKRVVYLKRVAIGDLVLDKDLKVGEYRELIQEELSLLEK